MEAGPKMFCVCFLCILWGGGCMLILYKYNSIGLKPLAEEEEKS